MVEFYDMSTPKFFTQWRPTRARGHEGSSLYVCAFWRVRWRDGKSKQAGCSISAERHGIEGAVAIAISKAKRHTAVSATPEQVLAGLSW